MNYKHGPHSIYDLKYHIIFCTKYRYRVLTREVGNRARELIREKRYWDQYLWARGYFAVTVGNVNEADIQKYLEEQKARHKEDNFNISEH
jgi:REP element-mobilizing transposase RayT